MLEEVGLVLVFGMLVGSLERISLNCFWAGSLLKYFVHQGYEMQ